MPYSSRKLGLGPVILAVMAQAVVHAGQPAQAPPGSYARAHYDLLLVENCGLTTREVQRGFELTRDERLHREGLSEAEARATRIQAGVAFDLEWQNRGLGGSRPWCREDGKQAALAFFARLIDERYPRPGVTP